MSFFLGARPRKDSHRPGGLSFEETQSALSRAIEEGGAYFAGRFGSEEYALLRTVNYFENSAAWSSMDTPCLLPLRSWAIAQKHRKMAVESDFVPSTYRVAQDFYRLMQDSARHLDLFGSWLPGDSSFFPSERPTDITTLGKLEPFSSDRPWTAALENKRVLIIHPCPDTVRSKYEKRGKLFPRQPNILPTFDLILLEPPTAWRGRGEKFEDWFDGLLGTYRRVMECDFDVAIIAGGAYGFPLASWISQLGRPVFQLDGMIDLLFGITGTRSLLTSHNRAMKNSSGANRRKKRGASWAQKVH